MYVIWWRQFWLTNNVWCYYAKGFWRKRLVIAGSGAGYTWQTYIYVMVEVGWWELGRDHYNWHNLSSEVFAVFSGNRRWHWWYFCLIQSILCTRIKTQPKSSPMSWLSSFQTRTQSKSPASSWSPWSPQSPEPTTILISITTISVITYLSIKT